MNFGLWTAQGLFAGVVLRGDTGLSLTTWQMLAVASSLLGIVAVYCAWWSQGLRDRNSEDKGDAHFYWNLVEETLEVRSPRSKRVKPERSWWKNWSVGSQIAITLLFALLDL